MSDEKVDELAVTAGQESVLKALQGAPSQSEGLLKEHNFSTKVEVFKGVVLKTENKVDSAIAVGLAFDTLSVPKRVEKVVMEPEQVVGILEVIEAYTNNEKALIPEQAINLLSSLLEDWRHENTEGAQGGARILGDLVNNRGEDVIVTGDEGWMRDRTQRREALYSRAQEVITRSLEKLAESYKSLPPLEEPVSSVDVSEIDSMGSISVLYDLATTPEQKSMLKTIATEVWRYLRAGEVSEELFEKASNDVMKNNQWSLYRGLSRLESIVHSKY